MLGFSAFDEIPFSSLPDSANPVIVGGYAEGGTKAQGSRKYFIQKGNKVLVFGSTHGAINALDDAQNDEVIAEAPQVSTRKEKVKVEPFTKIEIPELEIDLTLLKAFAKRKGELELYQKWIKQQEFEALTRYFEEMREEEDLELLLLYA